MSSTHPRHTSLTGDVRADTRRSHKVREAALSGGKSAPRDLIGASWQRMRAHGLDPGGAPEIAPLSDAVLLNRRERSGLQPLMPQLRSHLLSAGKAAGQIMVVSDADGRVLWREGGAGVRRYADRLGFVGGSAWTEGNVGTNAIGTCIVTGAPVHVHAAEHFAESHTAWTCAAAPLHDPLTGRLLGVVDLSGPARTGHANTLSLVSVAARLVEMEIREAHQEQLNELRALAAPLLARLGGRALVVAEDGTTAAVTGLVAPGHVPLPKDMVAGDAWFPALGAVTAEPLPGGWLVRIHDGEDGGGDTHVTSLVLDLASSGPVLRVSGPSGDWTHRPSPRHTEILLSLLRHRDGRSAAELASDVFADATRTVTTRAEVSRLRRTLGPLLRRQPYRISDGVDARLVLPERRDDLLPTSSAPIVAAVRAGPVR